MAMKVVRFIVRGGHLEPLEPLALVEGAEVDVPVPVVPARGTPSVVLAAMRELPHLDPSSIDDLQHAIESGRLPVRNEGEFDPRRAAR